MFDKKYQISIIIIRKYIMYYIIKTQTNIENMIFII